MVRPLLRAAKTEYIQRMGYHTDKHYVVIESDDWGSIRTPSAQTFARLQELGDTPQKDAFLSNDALESARDLEGLFAVLESVTDSRGRPAVMTANFAMCNPDFDKIDPQAGVYAREAFAETYKRYYGGNDRTEQTLREGIARGLFMPQLHCREHLNVCRWMGALKAGRPDAVTAFEHRMVGVYASFSPDNRFGYMDELNYDRPEELPFLAQSIHEAASRFEEVFGFRSQTFVASCFVWDGEIERFLAREGIRGIQTGPWQLLPGRGEGTADLRRKLRYTGQKSPQGLVCSVRNCTFEPAYQQNPAECVERAWQEVQQAFRHRKPAVIDTHRFNYIRAIHPANGEGNLEGLRELLGRIVTGYPDVVFLSSDQLIGLIEHERENGRR